MGNHLLAVTNSGQLAQYVASELQIFRDRCAQADAAAKDEAKQIKNKKVWQNLGPVQRQLLKSQTLYHDMTTHEYLLWSEGGRQISPFSAEAWLAKFPLEIRSILTQNAICAREVFNPTRGLDTSWREIVDGVEIVNCNTYTPPRWFTSNFSPEISARQPETYPPLFSKILTSLIPLPSEREIVLDWLARAVFDINQAVLSLRGIRGCGKSIFKSICYHLIGNFLEAQEKTITSEFNDEMRNKRVIGFDDNETLGTRAGNQFRKRVTSAFITYNRKHRQTERTTKNWASIIECSNTSVPFYLEHDERKIVSPLLTGLKMENWEWMRQDIFEWLDPLADVAHDPLRPSHLEFLRQIGHALFIRLLNRQPTINLQLKSGHYWEDVIQSLPSFKRFIVGVIRQNIRQNDYRPIEYDFAKAEYLAYNSHNRGIVPMWPTISKWLQEMVLYDLPLIEKIDNNEKTFTPNREAFDTRTYQEMENEKQAERLMNLLITST